MDVRGREKILRKARVLQAIRPLSPPGALPRPAPMQLHGCTSWFGETAECLRDDARGSASVHTDPLTICLFLRSEIFQVERQKRCSIRMSLLVGALNPVCVA